MQSHRQPVRRTPRPAASSGRPESQAWWALDPKIVFLNHGSFGSCPRAVLDYQLQLRQRMESQPIQFFVRDLEGLMDDARTCLAAFVGADPEDLVAVPNATAGVNSVLRARRFRPGDELLVTNQEYNACRNALDATAHAAHCRVRVARMPFPIRSAGDLLDAVLRRVTARTRLVLVDHVTSQTALVFPVADLARELNRRGVDVLVDGAHAPGMVPLSLRDLQCTYYTGNCHKWVCAPKGAAFLHVRRDRQRLVRPLVISHGANSPRKDRSRFQIEFGWTGTADPSAFLSVPEAIRRIGAVLPHGWSEWMARNHALACAARDLLCASLGILPPCPDSCLGAMAAFPIPDARNHDQPRSPLYMDPLQDRLLLEHQIEVPIIPWPGPPKRLLRVSAQAYNQLADYELLGRALRKELHGSP